MNHKCQLDKSVPGVVDFEASRVKGRQIGLLALWLKTACDFLHKTEHHDIKKEYCQAAFCEERDARVLDSLWKLQCHML